MNWRQRLEKRHVIPPRCTRQNTINTPPCSLTQNKTLYSENQNKAKELSLSKINQTHPTLIYLGSKTPHFGRKRFRLSFFFNDHSHRDRGSFISSYLLVLYFSFFVSSFIFSGIYCKKRFVIFSFSVSVFAFLFFSFFFFLGFCCIKLCD